MKPNIDFTRILVIAVFASSLIACAGPGPRPDSDLQHATSAIDQAESADAREFEPVLLNQARNKLADARELLDREKHRQAERLLEQAAVDAELAAARSETEKARQAVKEINGSIRKLRQELETEQR